jgi:hypothetical protein
MLHVAVGVRAWGQLFVCEKLGSPEIEMLLIVSAALPVENICICPARVWPSTVGLKLNGEARLKTTQEREGWATRKFNRARLGAAEGQDTRIGTDNLVQRVRLIWGVVIH